MDDIQSIGRSTLLLIGGCLVNIVLNFVMIGGMISIVFEHSSVFITIAMFHFGINVFWTKTRLICMRDYVEERGEILWEKLLLLLNS